MDFKKLFLNIVKLMGLIGLIIVINITPAIFLALGQKYQIPSYLEIIMVAGYLVLIGMILWTLWRFYSRHVQERFRMGSRDILRGLGYFLLMLLVSALGSYLLRTLSGQETTVNQAGIEAMGRTLSPDHLYFALLFVVGIGIIGPIVEELVFRGFAVVYFFKTSQKIWAGLITSALFALGHVINDLKSFPIYFAMGLVLFMAYAYRGSIKDSILVHALLNSFIALLMLLAMFLQAVQI